MATKNAVVIRIPAGAVKLEDNAQWTNRFPIHSETSNRKYIVSQNIKGRFWGCSCPAWTTRRTCKHLKEIGLPCHEVPFEAQLKGGK